MQYMSEFCVAAVIGTLVLFALYFLKRNYDTPHNRLFFCMVVTNLLSSAVNIASIYSIANPAQYSPFIRDLVNLGYLWLYNLLAGFFLLYADNVTKIPKLKTPVRIFFFSVHLLETFLIFTSPATKWIAYFDEALIYRHGILHPLPAGNGSTITRKLPFSGLLLPISSPRSSRSFSLVMSSGTI